VGISAEPTFLAGVIEGFYGRPWSFETRMAYADYLPTMGLDTYLYCPKADPFLRKRWHQRWPKSEFDQLKALSQAYKARSLNFGVGLSPFALYKNYGTAQRDLLQRKVEELNTLDMPLLAILFDDMPGDVDSLASRQGEIVADVLKWTCAQRVLICPTYYSFDPVLEKYFGKMPQDYWPQLGKELAPEVDIFWTGNQVCSESVGVADIESAQLQLGRPLVLWDNYPVNDGAQRSNFLYGSKLAQREPGLGAVLKGHLCNPMNQGRVSLLALQGLADLYGRSGANGQWLETQWGAQTYRQLMGDIEEFQQLGLSGMGEARCKVLAGIYGEIPGAAAGEVAGWLRGEYTFDPACLTD
jgi:hypothetical protein